MSETVSAWAIPPDKSSTIKRVLYLLDALRKYIPGIVKVMWKVSNILNNAHDYVVEGEAIDHEWILSRRELLEAHTLDEMRKQGFIPLLDVSPGLQFEFNNDRQTFRYTITVKGLKVGVDRAQNYMGILASQGLVIDKDANTVSVLDASF